MTRFLLFKISVLVFLFGALASCLLQPVKKESAISCAQTSHEKTVPQLLSQTCLYTDIQRYSLSGDVHRFTPNYQLWSDGADKSRWIYLPPGKRINSDDPDRWIFPVGTQFFKEFRKTVVLGSGVAREIKVETRHLMKVREGEGIDAWSLVAYAWQEDQQDALLITEGARHVLDTNHNIPSQEDCKTCHMGNIDIILGFDAIQLSDVQAKYAFGHGPKRSSGEWTLKTLLDDILLTKPMAQPVLPGNPMEKKVLGYLHANCGNCHNPLGHAAEQEAEHLKLRHKLAFNTLQKTHVYQTAVNQITQNFTIVPYIIMGAKHEEMALYNSALFVRMNSMDEEYRMPMIAREEVDYDALQLMHNWMLTLDTPEDYDFGFDKRKMIKNKVTINEKLPPLKFSNKKGLQVNVQFASEQDVPSVMILYWSEDKSLQANSVMDHVEGDFTEKLIVGNQGSTMSLRNSDDVGHTIYVKDKRKNIKWQLSYMPPGSIFEKELFWQEDIFVEMRCRLHLYMSAWVGSISSRFYKIVEFKEGQRQAQVTMHGYPEGYSQLKIWMPKIKPIDTGILPGEQQEFLLKTANKIRGKLAIKRLAQ
ncbi:MAG: hypothetical protein HRU20_00400 [Pseudomonadales bacterium]|nr:hypothetical protein [Pseudomonadales bacterium]